MRVLFLTKEYSPLGVICLRQLLQAGVEVTGVVTIGRYYKRKGWKKALKRYRHDKGLGFIMNRVLLTVYIHMRVWTKKLGLHSLFFSKSIPLHVGEVINRHRVEIIKTTNVNSHEFIGHMERMDIDLIVSCDFSQILKRDLLRIPKIGCINVHTSLLPKYRGPAPIFWVLFHEEKFTGVSIHWTTEQIDSGDILIQQQVPIFPNDDEKTLERRLAYAAASALSDLLKSGDPHARKLIKQSDREYSYFKEPSLEQRKQLAEKIKIRKRIHQTQ